MDPNAELLDLQDHFAAGRYPSLLPALTSASLPARILALRARIALAGPAPVLADLDADPASASTPALAALRAYASSLAGDVSAALKSAEALAASAPDDPSVQVLAGTVLQAHGSTDAALALLARHQGNLEAVALIVQIHLQQNRSDLALKEVHAAKKWAQDSLLINIAESWVGLRLGAEHYQDAFYVFEELAQAPAADTSLAILAQAVTELHLGRFDEAQASLDRALELHPGNADVLANRVVLASLTGKDTAPLVKELREADSQHPFVKAAEEKSELFDKAAAKYAPKVAAA